VKTTVEQPRVPTFGTATSGTTDAARSSRQGVRVLLEEIARQYPAPLAEAELADIPRVLFNIELVRSLKPGKPSVCDVGGGIGTFSVGCAALGMRSVLVDDFQDAVNVDHGTSILDIHRSYGVEVISGDVVADFLQFASGSVDVFTMFECIEHLHSSPKGLLHALVDGLAPGGVLIISAPNCVDLMKRISVPLGRGKWSPLESWYEADRFRGHVREPDVDDLRYIARDLGLKSVRVYGRNWAASRVRREPLRRVALSVDRMLWRMPSLCSNLYLVGTK
jgi:SAM-dependent methyltransferase